MTIDQLIDDLASPDVEVRREADRALRALSLGVDAVVPLLSHPNAHVREQAAWLFLGRREEAVPCAEHLVPLLVDPVESVRKRAGWAFAELGVGTVPVLRGARTQPGAAAAPLRRAALGALARTAGPAGLSERDVALMRRLIRIKLADETPEPMHLCGGWYAVRTDDQSAVLDAFGLSDPEPVTMRCGGDAWKNDKHDWSGRGRREVHRHCFRVYVSPVLAGWTLVFGEPSEDVHRRAGNSEEERELVVRQRCAALSARFGAAHWYGMSCGDGWTAWCLAEHGEVQRYYDVFTHEDEVGPQHPAEEGFCLPHEYRFPEDAFDGVDLSDIDAFRARREQLQRELAIPDDCYALDIAARTSVNPGSLGLDTPCAGHGLLALTACGREHGHPRGALRI